MESGFDFRAGGCGNCASGNSAAISGGRENRCLASYAAIGGGYRNQVTGRYGAVPGGSVDRVAGDYSLAAGSQVRIAAAASHTFAFGDDFATTTPDAAVFCHNGWTTRLGVGVENPTHNIDVAGGAYCNGTNWVNGSSRAHKRDIRRLSPEQLRAVLDRLAGIEVVNYRYRSEDTGEEHIGLNAEDAPEAIATPACDGMNTADAIGWFVAAAKAQYLRIEALEADLARLREPGIRANRSR
jgi:hypothetical protein